VAVKVGSWTARSGGEVNREGEKEVCLFIQRAEEKRKNLVNVGQC